MTTKEAQNMVDIRLDSPRTPESSSQMPQFNGTAAAAGIPGQDGKPYLRYYSVGPKPKTIICPLCKEKAEATEVMPTNFLDSLNCCLSCLSCCFPIFALTCLFAAFRDEPFRDQRNFCSKCGGHLGIFKRPC